MRLISNILLLILLFLYCISEPELDVHQPQNVLTDILTFELSFGDEGLPDEYLIVLGAGGPGTNFTVDDEENVYFFEEQRVKVYDKDGKSKAIIGRPGQGPGEFDNIPGGYPTVGPEGYVSVLNKVYFNYTYNVYDPDYKFLKTIKTSPFRGGMVFPCRIITTNENEYFREVFEKRETEKLRITKFSIEHLIDEQKSVIVSYDVPTDIIRNGGGKVQIPYAGSLFWSLLPNQKIAYIHTRLDERHTDEGSFYIFHVYDLDTGERKEISQQFNPVSFYESVMNKGYPVSDRNRGNTEKLIGDYFKSNNIKGCEALEHVFFDGTIAYAYAYTTKEIEKFQYHWLVDVIDLESGEYISSVYLPKYGRVFAIKNGYLYMGGKNEEGFARIEKYKIDPVVYGK